MALNSNSHHMKTLVTAKDGFQDSRHTYSRIHIHTISFKYISVILIDYLDTMDSHKLKEQMDYNSILLHLKPLSI